MATFLQLQTRVQTRLIDVVSAVSDEIPTLINEAVDALQSIHNWACMRAEAQYITDRTATNSHIIGQIPTNWKEPRGNPYYVWKIGQTTELVWLPNRQFTYRAIAPFDPNTMGPPRMLLIGEPTNDTVPDPDNPDLLMVALNLEVYPYPDGLSDWNTAPSGEYRINIPYWGTLPQLAENTDQNWFTTNATSFIIDFATARGFMLDWDEARAGVWYRQAWGEKYDGINQSSIGGWARVALNKDKSISFAPGRTLVPRRDVNAPRDQHRT